MTTRMVNWMKIRLEAAIPVQALVKKSREELEEPTWSPFFFLAFLPSSSLPPSHLPLFLPSFSFLVGWVWPGNWKSQGSLDGLWLDLGQGQTPSFGKNQRTHPSLRPWGSIHKSNTGNQTQNPCALPCQGQGKIGVRRLNTETGEYSWGMGLGWQQDGNNQKGQNDLPLTGLGGLGGYVGWS